MEQQLSLFPSGEERRVPGFTLRPEYISKEEEAELLGKIRDGPWEEDWRRRIQQFGLGYKGGGGKKPVWVRDFPEWLTQLGARVAQEARFERFPENCVINEYVPPQGIAPHTDYGEFGPIVACVSLGSDTVLDLVSADRSQRVSMQVPGRSLWVMEREARWEWMHGIAARKSDRIAGEVRSRGLRISVTFRTARDPGLVPLGWRERWAKEIPNRE